MRIEPTGLLAKMLTEHGRSTEPFDVDDDVLERFLTEVRNSQMFLGDKPVETEEEKQALAVFMARTHPGWSRRRLQTAVSLVDAVPFSESVEKPEATVKPVPVPAAVPVPQWPVWVWRGAVLAALIANVVATISR